MCKAFISYSHSDNTIATELLTYLESNDIQCWIDFRDNTPGEDYSGSIVRAIRACKFFIVIISADSIISPHVVSEIANAFDEGSIIIPYFTCNLELSDSLKYYLKKTHSINAYSQSKDACFYSLLNLISSETSEKNTISIKTPEKNHILMEHPSLCRMAKYEDIIALGYTSSTIAKKLVENDYINCEGIDEVNEGTPEQWEDYLRDESDTFQYLLNESNEIVGDWSIVALDDMTFERAKTGNFFESDIVLDNTEMLCFPGIYKGYILAISLLPNYRNMNNYNLLLNSLIDQIEEYSKNGIFFSEWCINVFGREVEGLVRRMGFKYICDNKKIGKMYSCSFIPLPRNPLINMHKDLINNYEGIEL